VLDARAAWIHPFRGPILPALGLIWNARTSLFPDSGLMHFAAASPGGVLGFFAETDVSPSPKNWAPRGPRATCLEAERSVAELSDDRVFAIVRSLVSSN
jgi:ADP-heptose:LPS heptosyltransferase